MNWTRCSSSAIEAYRFNAQTCILELLYVEGRTVYDYPCSELLFDDFLRAPSKGKFVNGVLKPHAERYHWTPTPRPLGAA